MECRESRGGEQRGMLLLDHVWGLENLYLCIIHGRVECLCCYSTSHGNVEVCWNSYRNTKSATPLLWNGLKLWNNTISSFSVTLGLVAFLDAFIPKASCLIFEKLVIHKQSAWRFYCFCSRALRPHENLVLAPVGDQSVPPVLEGCWQLSDTWETPMSCKLKISRPLHSRAQTASCILLIPCAVLGELIITQDLLQKTLCMCLCTLLTTLTTSFKVLLSKGNCCWHFGSPSNQSCQQEKPYELGDWNQLPQGTRSGFILTIKESDAF